MTALVNSWLMLDLAYAIPLIMFTVLRLYASEICVREICVIQGVGVLQ